MFNVCRVKTLFSNVKRAGDATKIMQLWQKIPAKIVYLAFQLIGMEFSHSPSKGKETKKKREKLKKRKERKRNDKWKESKAKNKKKIAFCKCIRNEGEPSSRLVNRALSYGFVEKPCRKRLFNEIFCAWNDDKTEKEPMDVALNDRS